MFSTSLNTFIEKQAPSLLEVKSSELDDIRLDKLIQSDFQLIDSNVKDIREAEIICLGENHGIESHKHKNAQLIDYLYQKGHCLLEEEFYPQKVYSSKQSKFVTVNIPKEGWDLYSPEIVKVYDEYNENMEELEKEIECTFNDRVLEKSSILAKYNLTFQKLFQNMLDHLPARNKYMCFRIEEKLKNYSRVFVIAGYNHFIKDLEPQDNIDYTSHNKSILETRNFLRTKKFLILIPN